MMKTVLLALCAYAMGFVSAIPAGATQIEIAKRALNGHLRAALLVLLGAIATDVMYGCIAFFGLAPFMEDPTTVAVFGLAGSVVLSVLAFLTFRQSSRARFVPVAPSSLKSGRLSLITGFSLGVTNPIMVFWWLVSAKIIRDIGLVDSFNRDRSLIFVMFGSLGLAGYLSLFAVILRWAKRFITDRFMQRVYFFLALFLSILSVYFLATSLHVLLRR